MISGCSYLLVLDFSGLHVGSSLAFVSFFTSSVLLYVKFCFLFAVGFEDISFIVVYFSLDNDRKFSRHKMIAVIEIDKGDMPELLKKTRNHRWLHQNKA